MGICSFSSQAEENFSDKESEASQFTGSDLNLEDNNLRIRTVIPLRPSSYVTHWTRLLFLGPTKFKVSKIWIRCCAS